MPSNHRYSAASKRCSTSPASKGSHKRPVAERVTWLPTTMLVANPRNSRKHPREQIHRLAQTIKSLGVFVPILIDEHCMIIAGHGRWEAAQYLGMTEVPTLMVSGLSAAQKRAFVIADNRLAEMAKWDRETLRLEFKELIVLDFDVELSGFSTGQIDLMLDDGQTISAEDELGALPTPSETVSRPGDLWRLDPHRLLCGDATLSASYVNLLDGQKANMIFTDAPYNVKIGGNVSGLGRVKHREFAMASGEMSPTQFTRFLTTVFGHLADHSLRGSIHYHFMDWRHGYEVLSAGREIYSELKNICVWNKNNAGMGSLYRSKHEFIFVYQNGAGRYTNNVNLGAFGRYRSNVWDYPGMTSMRKGRIDELAMHPTVKPVALVADAIRDCSKRNELVLDPFCGSGTTVIAAHRTGRIAAAMEIDPAYVDVAITRWQTATGQMATLNSTGESFDKVRAIRSRAVALTARPAKG